MKFLTALILMTVSLLAHSGEVQYTINGNTTTLTQCSLDWQFETGQVPTEPKWFSFTCGDANNKQSHANHSSDTVAIINGNPFECEFQDWLFVDQSTFLLRVDCQSPYSFRRK